MNSVLWTIEDMKNAMGAKLHGAAPDAITGISIDSRTIDPGEAYFAIKGDVHDGHKFVAAASANGAGVCVVSQEKLDALEGETGALLVVDDVLVALERLAIESRLRSHARIVAVTGSVGKTTTKEALRTALSSCGTVHASVASFNNHWGVPLTLARMPKDVDFGVFEIGMNHPNEITPLVSLVRPHVSVITNVAPVHLGAFASVDEIARAKAEIIDGLEDDGTVVLNADDPRFELLKSFALEKGVSNIVRFGEAKGADTRMENLVLHNTCSCLTVDVMGTPMVVKVGAPGKHIAQNALIVLTVAKLIGADLARAGLALADLEAVKGRGQRHKLRLGDNRLMLIDESYNANPKSMVAALELLAAASVQNRGRRIAALGDMLELGPTSHELHADLAEAITANKIDLVYLAGQEMTALRDALSGKATVHHFDTVDELIPELMSQLRSGDVVMAKASLGLKFARLIDAMLEAYEADT
ncbi:UDP-N-acetylmuramoylalanyl-D-glutamyl-2,6-diaminopimelate--D-alanyl-D-alanine ligase [Pseudahrensia aquimaris]|uniref:UDP-N-acetylmuramoyl-tripeptide--D-alanyl-D-alanine ligase n=1 Tax=Pseudahrensia aquimaris TaxID=744461 RepID=A0ABW3FEV5_9HYPH